jgi:hypothetical protein
VGICFGTNEVREIGKRIDKLEEIFVSLPCDVCTKATSIRFLQRPRRACPVRGLPALVYENETSQMPRVERGS